MSVDTKRFPGPAYQDVHPRLPKQPKHHHISYGKRIAAVSLAITVAGTAVGLALRKNDPTPNPEAAAAAMTKDELKVVYDGRQLINLTKSPDGEIQEKPTTIAQVLRAESFNVEAQGLAFVENIALPESEQTVAVTLSPESLVDAYFVPVLGNLYGQDAKDHYADIQVNRSIGEANPQDLTNPTEHILLDRRPQGNLYLRLSFADGTPIEGPNGKPIYAKPSQVNLSIPEQAPMPVTG